MVRYTKRTAVLALALAGAGTLLAAEWDTTAHPPAARPARAQRVDLSFPPPAAPPGHQLFDLKVRNGNSFHARVCVGNAATGEVCTPDVGRLSASTNAELNRVDVDPTAPAAKVIFRLDGQDDQEIDEPVTMDGVTTQCFTIVSAREFSKGCRGF